MSTAVCLPTNREFPMLSIINNVIKIDQKYSMMKYLRNVKDE